MFPTTRSKILAALTALARLQADPEDDAWVKAHGIGDPEELLDAHERAVRKECAKLYEREVEDAIRYRHLRDALTYRQDAQWWTLTDFTLVKDGGAIGRAILEDLHAAARIRAGGRA